MKSNRIEWQELRKGECGGCELVDVIADRDETNEMGWAFYEKTSWDVLWIRIPATPCRLDRVFVEEAKQEPQPELV
jgi:hypothetical protein